MKFHDLNGDGARAANEPGLAGWVIYLDANHNGGLDAGETSTTTTEDGSFVFAGLGAGNYLVAEVNQAGWRQTGPNVGPTPAGAVGAVEPEASHYAMGPHWLQRRGGVPDDPLFAEQWHLRNFGQSGGTAGEDVNVVPAWDQSIRGDGVTIGIVDDGFQYTHPDLAANYDASNSFDFLGNDSDPAPGPGDFHGTAVAGIAAAVGDNGIGVSGVAPRATLASLRLLGDAAATDAQEANALSHRRNEIDIYSNSWGPADDGETLEGPGPATLSALRQGVMLGRDGLGNVFVWAAGNGQIDDDNVNYDGYANSRYVIAVTGIDHHGFQAADSESGAPILVSAYSEAVYDPEGSGFDQITTTDRVGGEGYDPGDYTHAFFGTSAAAPAVAGVVALMLEANDDLTWRDVQHILVRSARRNDPLDDDWVANGAGRLVNHRYGYGVVDAAAAVALAEDWARVGAEVSATSGEVVVGQVLPDNSRSGLKSSVTIPNLMKVEKVEVVLDVTHPFRGDLSVTLESPDGTESVLAEAHSDDGDDYRRWTFTSTHHWDEIAKGTWTLKVADEQRDDVGTWHSWRLNLYGTALSGVHYVSLGDGEVASGLEFANKAIVTPPRVIGAEFEYKTAPHRVVVQFDRDVTGAIGAGELELKNVTTGQTVPASQMQVHYDQANRRAIWTFPGLPRGLLPDGIYQAEVNRPGSEAFSFEFFQLVGDSDRDRDVDDADFLVVYRNFRTVGDFSSGDNDYNGVVDFRDFQRLELAFGRSLKPIEAVGADEFEVAVTAGPGRRPMARGVFAIKGPMRRAV